MTNAPAVECAGQVLTFGELDHQSDLVAARLLEAGLSVGDVCAIDCLSLVDFVLGALGVVKSGGAYIALDNRPSRAAGQARLPAGVARFGLTRQKYWTAGGGVTPILRAFTASGRPADPEGAVTRSAAFNRVAYICFTSGTTGTPKGVLVPHSGIRGLISDPIFGVLSSGRRIASTSTFAFDAATFEVWGALLNGACVVDAPPECLRSAQLFQDFIRSDRIDGAFLTTSIFHALGTVRPETFAGLECLVIGGEACDPDVARRVLESQQGPARLINGYGPTETVTFATAHVLELHDLEQLRAPIGRPISGRSAYVVTEGGDLAPAGVEGELLVGGESVSLGYLHDPEGTAAKFIPDPFGGNPGGRLYRTGDICRMAPDGTIDFVGRTDDQVKVRGYRVELQGVAALLRNLSGVTDAVVVPRKDRFGALELVAFLTGEHHHSPAELRRQASTQMPDFMVPSTLHWVERFPLTATGKLDRHALLSLTTAQQEDAHDPLPAGDAVIEDLRRIWFANGVTGPVSEDDDYFDVGGNSLALISVALDIETRFGIRLPPETFGDRLTLNILATHVRASAAGQDVPGTGPSPRAFVVSHPWTMTRFPPEIGSSIDAGGQWAQLQIPPTEVFSTSYPTLSSMAAELVRQIRQSQAVGPFVLAGHSFGGVLAFEMARQLIDAGEQVERLILLDSCWEVRRAPFDRSRVWLRQSAYSLLQGDWKFFVDRAKRFIGGLRSQTAEPDRLALEILAHCISAMNDYRPQSVATRATIFRCKHYHHAFDRPELSSRKLVDPWDELVLGPNETVWVDTHHAGIVLDPPAIREVARHLSSSAQVA